MKTRAKPPSPSPASRSPTRADSVPTTDYRLPTTRLPARQPPGRLRARAEARAKEWAARTKPGCENCVYGVVPVGKWWRLILLQFPGLLACLNHPDGPGHMRETLRGQVCRNFRLRVPAVVRGGGPEPADDLVCTIPLTKGKQALVDRADFARLKRHKWCAAQAGPKWYAVRTDKGKCLLMHRVIMKARPGVFVDHKDGNGLNNCRSNLRFCSAHENSCNRGPAGKSSQYKGVTFDKHARKYYAIIHHQGDRFKFGPFDNEIDAARAYDRAALQYHGAFAYLNFPEEWPPQKRQEIMAQRHKPPRSSQGQGRKFRLGAPGRDQYRGRTRRSATKGGH